MVIRKVSIAAVMFAALFLTSSRPLVYAEDSIRTAIIERTLEALNRKIPEESKKQQEVFDFGAPPATNIPLAPNLNMGASLEAQYTLEKDFDLNCDAGDDRAIFEPSLALSFSYIPYESKESKETSEFFVSIEGGGEFDDDEKSEKTKTDKLELQQAFLAVSLEREAQDRFYNLKLGRQRFQDRREWIYDEELDGARFLYQLPNGGVEFSVSRARDRDLLREVKIDELTNYAVFGAWAPDKNNTAKAYSFIQDNKTSREKPIFYGLQLQGEMIKDLGFWLDYAYVIGKDNSKKIRAFGFDAGAAYAWDTLLKPSFTVSYAYGSGDEDSSDNKDKDFRQTGLQDNEAKFNGIANFKYYGELFDPELSNLSIVSAGIGIRPTHNSSIDILYHNYRQNQASNRIRDSEIDKRPNGIKKDLGQEIDLVFGCRYRRYLKASLVAGYFIPADAFSGNPDNALFSEFKVRYSF